MHETGVLLFRNSTIFKIVFFIMHTVCICSDYNIFFFTYLLRYYLSLAVAVTEEYAHRPINVYSVEQDGNHDGADDSLQCIFNPPGDPTDNNSNFWKDCRTNQDCISALTEDDTIYNTDYSVSLSEEGDYNLTINHVTSVSAGTYLCEARRGADFSRAKGRMLVIGELKKNTCMRNKLYLLYFLKGTGPC